jgi:hypothetical protein
MLMVPGAAFRCFRTLTNASTASAAKLQTNTPIRMLNFVLLTG